MGKRHLLVQSMFPFEFHFRCAEIQQQTNFHARCRQVIHQLDFMGGTKSLHCLVFHDDFPGNKHVGSKFTHNHPIINYPQGDFASYLKPRLLQFMRQGILINLFQKTTAQGPMDPHRTPDDFPCQFFFLHPVNPVNPV